MVGTRTLKIKQYNLHGEEIISEFPLEHVYNCDETDKYSHDIYCCCCYKSTKHFVLLGLFLSTGPLPWY